MYGKNPIMKQDLCDAGRSLRVVKGSPFYTIQGEGPFAGHPAVFVRLHGCNLRCWFCDTEFSDPNDPEIQTVRLARLVYDEIKLNHRKCNLVVITGGEPLRQDIRPFVRMLLDAGYAVQIETAGTLWLDGLERFLGPVYGHKFQIVCSPKTPAIHEMIYKHATAFKYVINDDVIIQSDVFYSSSTQVQGSAVKPLVASRPGAPVYLSPMDEYDDALNAKNRKRVAQLALEFGFIAGVQMHKLLEIVEP